MENTTPAVEAAGLTLRTRRGAVYADVDLVVRPGEIAMLVGATGSGKTALLLSLSGRMRATAGTLRVCGRDARRDPSSARRVSALGLFAGINDLADPLTVRDTVAGELVLHGRRGEAARVRSALARVGLDVDPEARIEALSAVERALLGMALALVGEPAVLLCDDIDHDLTPAEQSRLRDALRAVADSGVAVVGACVDARAAAGADVVIVMSPCVESEVAEHALATAR